jgi:hypothetical protein
MGPSAAMDDHAPPAASESTTRSISFDKPDLMEMFAQIARQHLGIATLKDRNRGSPDLHEVSVRAVIAALRSTYETGFAAGVRHSLH